MSKVAESLGPRITHQLSKLRERELLEGAMATSALVAMADRKVLLEENIAVASLIDNLELLKVYDPHLAVSLHTTYVEGLRADFGMGKRRALEAIRGCADDIEAALLLVQVGIAVAKADANFSSDEVSVIEEICRELDIEGLDALGLAGLRSPRAPH
jgi:tellurite resistance protein TerB